MVAMVVIGMVIIIAFVDIILPNDVRHASAHHGGCRRRGDGSSSLVFVIRKLNVRRWWRGCKSRGGTSKDLIHGGTSDIKSPCKMLSGITFLGYDATRFLMIEDTDLFTCGQTVACEKALASCET